MLSHFEHFFTFKFLNAVPCDKSLSNPDILKSIKRTTRKIEKANLTIKIGASNLLNNKVLQVYGGPVIGRMIYTTLSFDWKDKKDK